MLRPKRLPRFSFVRYFVQIERGSAGARQKRMPEPELVANMDRRDRFVFRRAWDHERLQRQQKTDNHRVMVSVHLFQ